MKQPHKIILVTGAASSGKSEFAEHLALQSQKSIIYIATAQKNEEDKEWCLKIEKHRQRRPKNWQILEIPFNFSDEIASYSSESCMLIDSLGTWVANFLDKDDNNWQLIVNELLDSIKTTQSDIIFVGEETGWGIVPAYELGRLFRDRLGKLIRQIGNKSDVVYLVTGGYALNLSVLGEKLPFSQD